MTATFPATLRQRPMTPDDAGRWAALLADEFAAGSSLHVDAQNPTGALGVHRRAGYRSVARQVTYALPAPS